MKPRARLLALAVASAVCLPGAARAQTVALPEFFERMGMETWWDLVQLSPWTASLGLTFDDQEQRLSSAGAPTERSSSRLATETFSIQNDGFAIINPKLFTGSVSLGFMLAQERQSVSGTERSQSGDLANYSFSGTFLPESPYTGTFTALRNQTTYVLPSGTTTKSDYEGRSLQLNLRENSILREKEWLPYFSANLRFAQQDERQTTTSGEQTFRQDDRRGTAIFSFQNGGETSDLSFQYQYTKLDNFAYEQGSYDSQSTNLYHSLDFGRNLNWRLDSRLNYYTRTGAAEEADLKNLEVSEFLTIDHNIYRSSTYSYQLNRQESIFGASTSHAGSMQVSQVVFANLSLTGGLNGIHNSLPGGTLTTFGGAGSFDYSHNLPWEGRLRLTGGAGYLRSDSDLGSGLVPVLDASYTVPSSVGAGASILLKDRNIETTTIIVVVLKGGARVAAYLDVDYTVRVEGDQTYLVPNPASAVMLPNDPLNVSYAYFVQSQAKYGTSSRSASIGGDWQWLSVYLAHDESDQKSLSGGSDLLFDQRRDLALVSAHGSWEEWTGRVGATVTDLDSSRLSYVESRLEQYASWVPYYGVSLSFSGNQYRTRYRLPEHTTTGTSFRLDLQWNSGGWLTTAYAGRRTYVDTEQPREVVDEAGVRMRKTWTKLDLSLGIGAQRRLRGESNSLNAFFHFGATRRF